MKKVINLKDISLDNKIKFEDRVQFYKARYLTLYRLIKKSAEKKKLTITSITSSQRQQEFLTVIRVSEIKIGKKYYTLSCEQLHNNKSYYYDIWVPITHQCIQSLYIGLTAGILQRIYDGRHFLVDIIYPHELSNKLIIDEDKNRYILAVSDIHIASVYFNADAFENCIRYVNENHFIKYLVIAGDATEGVNVYKDQQKGLQQKTFIQQQQRLQEYLSRFRNDVIIILSPGNHDNLYGIGEPQGNIYKNIGEKLENVIPVTNPAFLQIQHLKYIVYHGRCQNAFLREIPSISIYNCIQIQKLMLKSGHLSPMLTVMNICKVTESDSLLVQQLPHILHLGHTHIPLANHDAGITYVNGGSFQFITPFQKQMGIEPHTGSGVLINMDDYRLTDIIDFNVPTKKRI